VFANFFFSGSSSAGSPPVADFTGTPTSGTFPLSVTFTDASTGTPTAWLWEKNDGSGWVSFDGTPNSQNPTEIFAEGLWSVRLRAGNAGGSNTKSRIDYINSSATPTSLTDLSDLLVLTRPIYEAANSRFWQDDAKTIPADTPGDVIRVVTMEPDVVSVVDLTTINATCAKYGVDGDGFGYMELTAGVAVGGALTNANVLSPISTGPFHFGAYFYIPSPLDAIVIFEDGSFIERLKILNTQSAITSYSGVGLETGNGTVRRDAWQIFQVGFDGVNTFKAKLNNETVITATVSPSSFPSRLYMFVFGEEGQRIGSFFWRHAAPTTDDFSTGYLAGPNGDGSNWPPPLAVTNTVMYSGGIIKSVFGSSFTLGIGDPVVKINGTPVTCPRYFQIDSDTLLTRIPAGSFVSGSADVVTITFPEGLISLGFQANVECTNNTGVETLPTVPDVNASNMRIGVNSDQPEPYSCSTPFADGTKLLSSWNNPGGSFTLDANGYPATTSGGSGLFARFFTDRDLWPTGSYLLRTIGAGTAAAYDHDAGTPYAVTASGTAGGYNYQAFTVPAPNTGGLEVRVPTAPLTKIQVLFPGTWDGTHLPTTDFYPAVAAAYGPLIHYRLMDFLGTNNSNAYDPTDFIADGYYSQVATTIRTPTANITSTSLSSSTYLSATIGGGGTVYLITHDGGDIFQTGQNGVVGSNGDWLIERIDSTHIKALSSGVPSGTISVSIGASGNIEDAIRLVNGMNQDVWICVPSVASDATITSMANRVLALLEAGRKCIVEYSNEVWNFGFRQGLHAIGMGAVLGIGSAGFYGRKSADVHKLFLDAFTTAGRSGDLIRFVGWQEGTPTGQTSVLDYYKSQCVSQGYSFSYPTWMGIAPYYGYFIGGGSDPTTTRFRDFLMNGSNTTDPLSAAQFCDLAEYNLTGEVAGLVASFSATITAWNLANSGSVLKVTYEGSQTFTGARGGVSGCTSADGPNYAGSSGLDGAGLEYSEALKRTNRHPRMVNLQYESMKQCLDAGFSRWTQFTCDQHWSQDGYWGARTFMDEVVGPGDGSGGSHDNRIDLDDEESDEAVKLYACLQWQSA
jgi:PKD repeat protein